VSDPRRHTEWSGPPVPLRTPRSKYARMVTADCNVRGCDEPAEWWRTVGAGVALLGAALCDGHKNASLVSWSMPPIPPLVIVAEQLTLGGPP